MAKPLLTDELWSRIEPYLLFLGLDQGDKKLADHQGRTRQMPDTPV